MAILTINGGSSSIRFALYGADFQQTLSGKLERIGNDPRAAAEALFTRLEGETITAIGHRIVHGMKHSEPMRVTSRLIADLRRIVPYDPDHLPLEIALLEAFAKKRVPQVACFDTAFHRGMPAVAKRLPLPRRYARQGIERYGFHGLSYTYLLEELARLDPAAAKGRVILAHLGGGASLAAIHQGHCLDTTMGFTPTAGLMMGTRSGDLDPGLFYYLSRNEGMTATQFQKMVNHESGLKGVSGTTSDIRELLARETKDPRAAEAIELFCYQARKWIGAYTAVLGGLDTVVFSAGIGENSSVIRERICHGLGYLGLRLHRSRNDRHRPLISTDASAVKVRVIPTNEELMIARTVTRVLRSK